MRNPLSIHATYIKTLAYQNISKYCLLKCECCFFFNLDLNLIKQKNIATLIYMRNIKLYL